MQMAPLTGFDLSEKVAIVTGGSRGIGREIALTLSRAGAKVVVASRKQQGLEAVVEEIAELGGEARAVPAHLGDEVSIVALAESAVEAFGGVDILVNNAATNPHFGALITATTSQWDKIMQVNLRGAFCLCQQIVPLMQKRGGGKIINMASIAGIRPQPGMGIYGVSKAGIIMLTQVLAAELGSSNIQVNAIAPGVIKTRFSQVLWQTPHIADPMLARLPGGRFGEPEDVAGLALYLASSASDYVTGAVLVVDGGMNVVPAVG